MFDLSPTCARARPTPAIRSTTRRGSTWWCSARTPRISTRGVEFHPLPDACARRSRSSASRSPIRRAPRRGYRHLLPIITRRGCQRIVRAAFEYAQEARLPQRHRGGEAERRARDVRADPGDRAGGREGVPRHRAVRSQHRRDVHVAAQEPARSTACSSATNLFGDIISDLCAQLVGGLGSAAQRQHRRDATRCSSRPTARAPKYAGQYKVNPIATILAVKLMLDWLGEKPMAAARGRGRRGDQGREGPHLRHGRQRLDARPGQGSRVEPLG